MATENTPVLLSSLAGQRKRAETKRMDIWSDFAGSGRSGEDRADRFAPVGDADRPAGEVGEHQVGVDAEQVVDRGDEVARGDGVVERVGGELVGRAEDEALLDAAAEEEGEAALGPVVAAGVLVDPRACGPSRP